jgi:S1-C subfamily serine protease
VNAASTIVARDTATREWLGAKVRNIADAGGMSAFGLPGVTGVLIVEVPPDSPPMKAGLKKNDVILSVNGAKTADVACLLQLAPSLAAGHTFSLGVSRDQTVITLLLAQLK